MRQNELWDRLTETFRDVFADESIVVRPETSAKDLDDWDSLRHIELLVAIEQEFGVRFNTGEVAGLQNVGDMVRLIEARAQLRDN